MGYMPGDRPWYVGEKLRALGVGIFSEYITGLCQKNRKLTTGDSPFTSNKLAKLVANALLEQVATL